MKKLKKIFSALLSVLLVVTTTVSGTMAYEAWTAQEYADNTNETIKIKLVEQQRVFAADGIATGLETFADNKLLEPVVKTAQSDEDYDKYGMPKTDGYVDKIVRVENRGTGDAYVRVAIAVPASLEKTNSSGHRALHWNSGEKFMADGHFSPANNTNPAFEDISAPALYTAEIAGELHNIYTFDYKTPLASGDTTQAAVLTGFYLDSSVDVVDGHIMLDGVDTGFKNDTVKIYVKAQAVQAYGFETVAEAFTTADIPANPWR